MGPNHPSKLSFGYIYVSFIFSVLISWPNLPDCCPGNFKFLFYREMTNYDVTTADVTKMGYIYIFLKFQYSGDEWPIKIARKILPLLDLLAKFKRVLACSCSPNFCSCSQARKANFLFLLVLAKKSQCSACSRMLAKTIRHPSISHISSEKELEEDKGIFRPGSATFCSAM